MQHGNRCALEEIVGLIGDRWSLLLVSALLSGPKRTTELATILSPISTRTLAERLKRLDGAGLLTRRAYPEAPPRVEYALTERGFALRPVLVALRRTALSWEHSGCESADCDPCELCAHDGVRSRSIPGVVESDRNPKRQQQVDVTLL